ncbi:hypothetical protein G9A89_019420 [Geosiphon pyriformis]|nr:hypothetical protein G9A89_019420 [Geosiphon pyriformis]
MSYQSPHYTAPPPAYSSINPLAGPSSAREPSSSHGLDDVPDDFKYGVTVAECDISIRNAFVSKVYSILGAQLLTTIVMGAIFMYNDSLKLWVYTHSWLLWVSIFGSLGTLFALGWKSQSYPTNYILLGIFTLLEGYAIATAVTFYEKQMVLQALIITFGIFVGLTLFTLQSKWDFSGMGPILIGALWVVIILGLVQIFIPFSTGFDLVVAIGTAVIFCGFIIYDTFNILNRLSPEEYVMGAISLYLDFLNLFLNILRILNDLNRD